MITYEEKEFKSILLVRKFIDHWFWGKYGLNPYNGCQFGCLYCDSRSQKYYLPANFENNIVIKKNAAQLLDRRLTNARTLLPDVVGIGGTTDPYQPAESKYKNTRQCLEVLAKHSYAAHVCTKSRLVLQDLDILEAIGAKTWCAVSVTVTTIDDQIARFLEERAPLPAARFEVIRTIKEKTKHVQTGILLMPIVPFLCDTKENLEAIVRTAREAGADYILFGAGMTLRDEQAKYFLRHLQEKYPHLIEKYENIFNFEYDPRNYAGSYGPDPGYAGKLNKIFYDLCQKYRMPFFIKRFIPNDLRKNNYRIAEKLFARTGELQLTGQNGNNYFWAGQNVQNAKEPIRSIEDIRKLRGMNPQIVSFIKENIAI